MDENNNGQQPSQPGGNKRSASSSGGAAKAAGSSGGGGGGGVQWTSKEDRALLKAVAEEKEDREADGRADEEEDWDEIAISVDGKSAVQCLKRHMVLSTKKQGTVATAAATAAAAGNDGSNGGSDSSAGAERSAKRQKTAGSSTETDDNWTADEIALLRKLVEQYKDTAPRWNDIASNFGDAHNAIECLTKWQTLTNPPVIKGKGSWTPEEDQILRDKRTLYGRKWSKIAAHLRGPAGKAVPGTVREPSGPGP